MPGQRRKDMVIYSPPHRGDISNSSIDPNEETTALSPRSGPRSPPQYNNANSWNDLIEEDDLTMGMKNVAVSNWVEEMEKEEQENIPSPHTSPAKNSHQKSYGGRGQQRDYQPKQFGRDNKRDNTGPHRNQQQHHNNQGQYKNPQFKNPQFGSQNSLQSQSEWYSSLGRGRGRGGVPAAEPVKGQLAQSLLSARHQRTYTNTAGNHAFENAVENDDDAASVRSFQSNASHASHASSRFQGGDLRQTLMERRRNQGGGPAQHYNQHDARLNEDRYAGDGRNVPLPDDSMPPRRQNMRSPDQRQNMHSPDHRQNMRSPEGKWKNDKHQQNNRREDHHQNNRRDTNSRQSQHEAKKEARNRDRKHTDERNGTGGKQLARPKKNTENFNPCHEPPEMRILFAPPGRPTYNRAYSSRDVVIVADLFGEETDLTIYNNLLHELEESGVPDHQLWQSWHGDSHVIADDKRKWKEYSPTFMMILDKLKSYFNMDVKATRLNWYRDTSEWKPFHHDAAAMKPDKARTQNFTVGVSFGVERDAAFEHADTKTVISMPQPNGTVYTFGKDVNILWRHGILQVPPERQSQQGRISIIAWGWIPQMEL